MEDLERELEETEKIFVVDPDDMPKGPNEHQLEQLDYADAYLVGGSKDIEVEETLTNGQILKNRFPNRPVRQEPSHPDHVSGDTREQFDGIVVSMVLNGDLENLIGKHAEFFEAVDDKYQRIPDSVPFSGYGERKIDSKIDNELEENLVPQSYVVQNPDCDAADEAGVTEDDILDRDQMKARARYAEHLLGAPIFYIEYSGEYGDTDVVEAAANVLKNTHLRYGGGIENTDQVEEMLEAGADSVVVGTSFEDGMNPFNPDY
jgi:phosphoglycerol geranylgeranyltransferase